MPPPIYPIQGGTEEPSPIRTQREIKETKVPPKPEDVTIKDQMITSVRSIKSLYQSVQTRIENVKASKYSKEIAKSIRKLDIVVDKLERFDMNKELDEGKIDHLQEILTTINDAVMERWEMRADLRHALPGADEAEAKEAAQLDLEMEVYNPNVIFPLVQQEVQTLQKVLEAKQPKQHEAEEKKRKKELKKLKSEVEELDKQMTDPEISKAFKEVHKNLKTLRKMIKQSWLGPVEKTKNTAPKKMPEAS